MCERLGNDVSVALAEALWPGQDDQVGGGLTGHGDDVVRRHAATADQLRAVDCALADRGSGQIVRVDPCARRQRLGVCGYSCLG